MRSAFQTDSRGLVVLLKKIEVVTDTDEGLCYMSYQDYITNVIEDYIFMNPPMYPNYKELKNIGKQEGIVDLANKVKAFLSSFYNMDAGEIRMSLLEIGMPIEAIESTIRLLRK